MSQVLKLLDDNMLVAGQISPDDLAEARTRGVTLVINNRPDGEVPEQPLGQEIAAAAEAAGMTYVEIPVSGGFSLEQVTAMREALAGAQGPVLAFCRSGTRSTNLWSLARATMGDDPDRLAACAAAQGYDLMPLMGVLKQLASQAR